MMPSSIKKHAPLLTIAVIAIVSLLQFTWQIGIEEAGIKPIAALLCILVCLLILMLILKTKSAQDKNSITAKRFAALIENSSDIIWLTDKDSKIIYVSPSYQKITDYSPDEMKGMISTEIKHPDNVAESKNVLKELLEKPGVPIYRLNRFRHKKGYYVWVEGTVINLLHDENVQAIVSNYRDITERKKAEEEIIKLNEELEQKVLARTIEMENNIEKLRESEEKFEKAFQSSAAGISITRLSDSTYMDVNNTFERMTGFSRKEIIGHTSVELGMVADITKREEVLKQIRVNGYATDFEINVKSKSGEIINVIASIETIILKGEKYALNIIYNVTDRKRAEEQLFQSNKLLNSLFESNPAGISISRVNDAKIINVNEAYLSMSGYSSKEEVLGKTARELNMMANPQQREEIVNLLKENKIVKDYELKMFDKKGNTFWVSTSILMLDIENVPCLFSISIDISNRKKIEEQLKQNNQLLSNLFENNPGAILISRLSDAEIMNVNKSFLQTFGYSNKNEVIGSTARKLNIVAKPEQREEITALLKENKIVRDFEIKSFSKQGKIIWLSSSLLIIEVGGEPCLFSISIDISERKKAEEQLLSVNKELESFSYSVSHDLRAPLRAIHGFSQILAEDYVTELDDEAKRVMSNIMNNAKRMGVLIDDLLTFSRLNRKEIQQVNFSMNKLVQHVCDDLQKEEPERKINFQIKNQCDAKADSTALKQVWVNLISNAIKYSRPKENATIEIESIEIANEIIYKIKDNGVGFDMRYIDKLFGVFQRLHSDDEFEGTGVGLAIVQRIVNKHGGTVKAESVLNKGSIFQFSLPKTQPST